MNRCVNIDWLEVFCSESVACPRDAQYFVAQGYEVKVRDYGTPQYQEMFTIYQYGFPYIEVRRKPYSLKANGGIFEPNDCHIRLANRTCYLPFPIDELRKFLLCHDYFYKSLSRIDICMDFNVFDLGDKPENVISAYMRGKLSKLNQSRVSAVGKEADIFPKLKPKADLTANAEKQLSQEPTIWAHGKDNFFGRVWNSLKWGSPKSMVSTKLYNKSLELDETHDKKYIRDAWRAAGLDEDKGIWRVEFSINSDMKHLLRHDTGELDKHDLSCYDTPLKLLFRFHSLANRYFHFKYFELKADGKPQRKDRCKDKVLFRISKDEAAYTPIALTLDRDATRTDRILIKKLLTIGYDETKLKSVREACFAVVDAIASGKRLENYIKFLSEKIMFGA